MEAAEKILSDNLSKELIKHINNMPYLHASIVGIMRGYAIKVAEQALKEAANNSRYVPCLDEYVNEKSCIESTPIITP